MKLTRGQIALAVFFLLQIATLAAAQDDTNTTAGDNSTTTPPASSTDDKANNPLFIQVKPNTEFKPLVSAIIAITVIAVGIPIFIFLTKFLCFNALCCRKRGCLLGLIFCPCLYSRKKEKKEDDDDYPPITRAKTPEEVSETPKRPVKGDYVKVAPIEEISPKE